MDRPWLTAGGNDKWDKERRDRECIVCSCTVPREKSPLPRKQMEAGPGSWQARSQVIKMPTARNPVVRLQENNWGGEREKKRGKQGATVHHKWKLTQYGQQEADSKNLVGENTQPTESSTSADESQYGPVPSGGDDWERPCSPYTYTLENKTNYGRLPATVLQYTNQCKERIGN